MPMHSANKRERPGNMLEDAEKPVCRQRFFGPDTLLDASQTHGESGAGAAPQGLPFPR